MPDKSFQYCQRFIMQVEESLIDRMSKTQVQWDFTRQEKMAMDDMRQGQELSGLFGYRSMSNGGKDVGLVYTMGGIFWEAGKDLQIGHWEPKMRKQADGTLVPVTVKVTVPDGTSGTKEEVKQVYEYVISEKELTQFIASMLKGAGNSSRTKLLFVDNLIYQAFANLRSNKRIITQTERTTRDGNLTSRSLRAWELRFSSIAMMLLTPGVWMVEPSAWMLVILTNMYSVHGHETSSTLRIS